MDHTHAHDVKKEVRGYIGVFVALAGLTALTVFASYLHVSRPLHIAIALTIAVVKGGLVAAYFMHLISEKKLIWWALLLTATFWVGLMFMPLITTADSLAR